MKTELVFARLEPALKRALERSAKADERTVSSLIRKILGDWLAAQPAKDKPR